MSKFSVTFFKIFSALALCMSSMATAACPLPAIDVSVNPVGTTAILSRIGMTRMGQQSLFGLL